jgi:hypothetical protein
VKTLLDLLRLPLPENSTTRRAHLLRESEEFHILLGSSLRWKTVSEATKKMKELQQSFEWKNQNEDFILRSRS